MAFALGASYDLAFAPDGSALFVVAARVQRWDVASGTRTHTAAWAHGSGIDVSPDGTRVAVANTSGDVAVLDADTLEQLYVVPGREFGEGTRPLFTADGAAFVIGSWSGHLIVRATETGEIIHREHEEGRMLSVLACSPDRMVFAEGGAVRIRRWPFTEHAPRALPAAGDVRALALDGAGRLATQSFGSVAVYDLASGEALARYALDGLANDALAWAPDGALAAVGQGQIVELDGDTLAPRWATPLPYACAVAYAPAGDLVALGGSQAGTVTRREPAVVTSAPDEDEVVSVEPRDEEEAQIIGYVEIEATEGVVALEKVERTRVGAVNHDVWDVRCESTRWWAITGRSLAAYDQRTFPHRDVALTFHVGMGVRLDDDEVTYGGAEWRCWAAAAQTLADAADPAAVPAVARHLLEALAAASVPEPLKPVARGLTEYLTWLASAQDATYAQAELAVNTVRGLLHALS